MFDKFGEFDSAEEINELAENMLNEGDTESIKTLAAENGIGKEFVKMYLAGDIPVLCDAGTAAIGKLETEEKALKPGGIMKDRKHFGKAEDEPKKAEESRPVSKNTGEIQNTAAAGETERKKSPQNGSVHLECENTAISDVSKSEFDMTKTVIEEVSPQNGSVHLECENRAISETPKTESEVTKRTEEIPGIAPTACQPAKPQDVWGQQEEGRAEETNDAQAAGMTRKDYICSLSVPDAAEYLKAEHHDGRLTVTMFHFVDQLEKWLGAYVDEHGEGK